MLVLSRKVGEKILIGGDISVTVVRVSGGGVRIGIEAPSEMAVVREELAEMGIDPKSRGMKSEDSQNSVPAEINRSSNATPDKPAKSNRNASPKKPR